MNFPPITPAKPAVKPNNPAKYSPSKQPTVAEEIVPKTGTITQTLIRIAMRKLPGFGYGAVHGKAPSVVKDAVTMGSHGNLK